MNAIEKHRVCQLPFTSRAIRISLLTILSSLLCVASAVGQTVNQSARSRAENGQSARLGDAKSLLREGDGITGLDDSSSWRLATTEEARIKKAVQYYRRSADLGSPAAQHRLGVIFSVGCGVEQNLEEAVRRFRLAAEAGHAAGQTSLGVCYYHGEGVQQDYRKAAHWYRQAAEQGDAEACFRLGLAFRDGHGVERSGSKFIDFLQKAVTIGHSEAAIQLGIMYAVGRDIGPGIRQDEKKATELFTYAAAHGDQQTLAELRDKCLIHAKQLFAEYKQLSNSPRPTLPRSWGYDTPEGWRESRASAAEQQQSMDASYQRGVERGQLLAGAMEHVRVAELINDVLSD